MKKLALAFLFCGAMAFADSITYSTSGSFSSSALTNGGSLSFQAEPTVTIGSPTELTLGYLSATCAAGSVCATTTGQSFTLTFSQQMPTMGNQPLSGSLTGTVTGSTSSTIVVTFTQGTWSIGNESYNLGISQNPVILSWGVTANTTASNGAVDAFVVSTPEPASLSMIGAGLIGLGLVARRRFAK